MDGYGSDASRTVRPAPVPLPEPERPDRPLNGLSGSVVIGGSAGGAPLGPLNDADDKAEAERFKARPVGCCRPLSVAAGGGGGGMGIRDGAPEARCGEPVSGAAGR
jgi:hypothetical protein